MMKLCDENRQLQEKINDGQDKIIRLEESLKTTNKMNISLKKDKTNLEMEIKERFVETLPISENIS